MILSVHQPQYIPWLGYFEKIRKSDVFVFLDNVQYKKREFQNRNKIRTSAGSSWLTVPVITKDKYLQKIADVTINNETDWASEHWKSIQHNYARAEHFSAFRSPFEELYRAKWDKLAALNVRTVKILLELFKITTPVIFESTLGVETTSTQRIVDICLKLKADTYLSGTGGKAYMDESLFEKNGIKLEYQHFTHPAYPQAFPGFEPYMSSIDYLFNCGAAFPG